MIQIILTVGGIILGVASAVIAAFVYVFKNYNK
jgi:hypothetical protein